MLISFAYTNCPDICPLTTARTGQVEEKLGDMVGRSGRDYEQIRSAVGWRRPIPMR